jgi:hypothetical protein
MGAPSLQYHVCGELPLILSPAYELHTTPSSPANSGMLRKYG